MLKLKFPAKAMNGGFVSVKDLTRVLVFLMGFCGGIIFIVIISLSTHRSQKSNENHKIKYPRCSRPAYSANFKCFNNDADYPFPLIMSTFHRVEFEERMNTHSINETFHKGEDVIADQLKAQVRVLCLVLTDRKSYSTNGEAVNNTWGPHCNTLLFVSDFEDSSLPVLKLYGGKAKRSDWALVKSAMKHIYVHLMDSHDWVLRVTDKTFVVIENLRYLLMDYKPSDPLYLGCRFKKHVKQGFMSGGAGYVLSKEAVTRMVKQGLPKEICSTKDEGPEDVEMGRCMESLGVIAVDTRDSLGRGRFFPFSPEKHILPDAIPPDNWYWDMVYYPPHSGFNCCSDSAITFNEIDHNRMFVLNYLIYHLRPYGISSHHPVNETNLYIVIK